MKKIVVVGAGYAGVLTAKKLEKTLRKMKLASEYEITIIDKRPFHTMLTELHEVAAWRVEEDSIRINLSQVFAGRKVKVVLDTVCSIDYEGKKIVGELASYDYDYMVLATGSKPTYFGIKGAEENSFPLWTYEDAVHLREHIVHQFRAASTCTDPALKKEELTFVVIGAGFTGVEMAGELAEFVPYLCERFEIPREDVSIICTDALDRVCPVLPENLSPKVQRRMEKMGIDVRLGETGTEVGKDFIESKKKDGTISRYPVDTVIWTAGVEGSAIATESMTAIGGAGRGRIQTDEFLRSDKDKSVYIAGDNIFYIPEGEERPVPQMVENCEACADVIAHNMICQMTGKGEMEKYAPKFHGVMVSIGGRYGVAHVGPANHLFGLPSFLAMFAKHFINIIYFISVLGWAKISSYIRHEFFTIRNRRSFVGGHFSNRSMTFWLVPLRMFLGFFWVYEGIVKIQEGWMTSPKLTAFFQGANNFYNSVLYPGSGGGDATSGATTGAIQRVGALIASTSDKIVAAAVEATSAATAAGTAADAASAATGAADAAAATPGFFYFGMFGDWLQFILVKGSDAAFKVRVGLVDWIIDSFVIPHDNVQMIFQIVIVLAEIAVGLALFGGFFTTPAAAVSIALQAMFLTSTGLYMSTWWMVFAGIAMFFGAGRVFSCDYYIMPALRKWWKKVKFAKKWYLYND